jgi:hypothetical protein
VAQQMKFTKKQLWMQEVEAGIIKWRPSERGKIDWDTLNYLFMTKVSAKDAINKMVKPFEDIRGTMEYKK